MNERLERLYKRKAFYENELETITLDISFEEKKDEIQREEAEEEFDYEHR